MKNRLVIIVFSILSMSCNAEVGPKCSRAMELSASGDIDGLQVLYQGQESSSCAALELGNLYFDGMHVEQDYHKAVQLTEEAAKAGIPKAQYELSIMLLVKTPVQDIDRALHWMVKASDGGNLNAKVDLGVIYIKGELVPQDFKKGVHLLISARESGSSQAASILERMSDSI